MTSSADDVGDVADGLATLTVDEGLWKIVVEMKSAWSSLWFQTSHPSAKIEDYIATSKYNFAELE